MTQYIVITTYGLGPDVDGTEKVYGPFDSEDAATAFAHSLPPVERYERGAMWTDHSVFPLIDPELGQKEQP